MHFINRGKCLEYICSTDDYNAKRILMKYLIIKYFSIGTIACTQEYFQTMRKWTFPELQLIEIF